jgi:hypothetical protein
MYIRHGGVFQPLNFFPVLDELDLFFASSLLL